MGELELLLLLLLLLLPEGRDCLWFLGQRAPSIPDRSVAGRPWHRVENRILEAPIVVFLLLELLQLHCCACLNAGPQVCNEVGRIFRGHDIAGLDHRLEVGLPFTKEPQVGGVLPVFHDQFRRLRKPFLPSDCGSSRLGPPWPLGRCAGFRIGLASFGRACLRSLPCGRRP